MERVLSIEEENSKNLKSFMLAFASYYTVILYLVFSVVDYIFYPSLFLEFFAVRVLVVVTLLGATQIIKNTEQTRYTLIQLLCSIPCMFCALSIQYMVLRINDPVGAYWAGLAIVTAGISVGFAFSWAVYLFNVAVVIFPFLGATVFYYLRDNNISYFLNAVFLFSIAFVCIVGRWFYIKLSLSEYFNRKQLAEEIESRNKIIEVKTQESIRLNTLNKQFSPQIVQSIQSGVISLSSKIHRSEICTIFVDIKDSTVKFSTLDRDNLQKIIAMYMEDVMNIFLKYDITIDKFLGDGIMGFTNDPLPQHDFVERAILAGIEVKNRILLKQELYSRLWGSEFEVRVGISCGYASVGFYGSDLHVKSYTAIGRVVNLASRVNGVALPNQVAITHDVLEKINEGNELYLNDYKLEELRIGDLKGFENEQIKVYSIDKLEKRLAMDDESCPQGHGPLVISQLTNGIYVMKCRYCEYVLDESKPNYNLQKVS